MRSYLEIVADFLYGNHYQMGPGANNRNKSEIYNDIKQAIIDDPEHKDQYELMKYVWEGKYSFNRSNGSCDCYPLVGQPIGMENHIADIADKIIERLPQYGSTLCESLLVIGGKLTYRYLNDGDDPEGGPYSGLNIPGYLISKSLFSTLRAELDNYDLEFDPLGYYSIFGYVGDSNIPMYVLLGLLLLNTKIDSKYNSSELGKYYTYALEIINPKIFNEIEDIYYTLSPSYVDTSNYNNDGVELGFNREYDDFSINFDSPIISEVGRKIVTTRNNLQINSKYTELQLFVFAGLFNFIISTTRPGARDEFQKYVAQNYKTGSGDPWSGKFLCTDQDPDDNEFITTITNLVNDYKGNKTSYYNTVVKLLEKYNSDIKKNFSRSNKKYFVR